MSIVQVYIGKPSKFLFGGKRISGHVAYRLYRKGVSFGTPFDAEPIGTGNHADPYIRSMNKMTAGGRPYKRVEDLDVGGEVLHVYPDGLIRILRKGGSANMLAGPTPNPIFH